MNAVIYARYSSDRQREESIEGQLRECTDYAMKNNLTLLGTYVDRALSARTADRPDFQRMIADSAKGLFDVVLVWKLDRFSRDRYDSAHYKHVLKKNGVRVISIKENISDGPEGIILESMLEGYAEYYSAELAQKIRRGQHDNAMKCMNNGGNTPLGYYVDKATGRLEINPETAPYVQELFARYADGERLTVLQAEMEERVLSIMKDYPFLVVEEEGIILGYAYGHVFYAKEAYFKSVEVTIYMDQNHKRKGLGSALYKELELQLKAQGRENLFACIAYSEDENDPYLNRDSILFHQRNGYVQCGHFHRSGMKFQRTYDTVYMEKHI